MAKSRTVFTVVAVITIAGTIASTGFGSGARARFAEAKARAEAQGASARTPSNATVPLYREGREALEEARVHASAGRRAEAASALARALGRAKELEGRRSFVSSFVASKLVAHVLDRTDGDPSLLDDPVLAAALRRTTLPSARRPLASERLHALARLATIPEQVPLRTGGLVESVTTDAMREVERTLGEMEAAVLAGDLARCEQAALSSRGVARQVTVGPSFCKHAGEVVTTNARLERVRARVSG
ncbi:MAG: hypothetical protein KF819_00490 [Labilithrix sp.]|nr:hypothetical protein [Labilithrix sp.]